MTPKEVVGGDGSLRWSADHDTWGTLRTKRGAASAQIETGDYWIEPTSIDGNTAQAYAPIPDAFYCPIRFQGQWEDAETGLYYNRYRYYCPLAIQYVAIDPIGIFGGLTGYQFVRQPTTEFDPKGLRNATVANGVLCLVNKFPTGSNLADEFDAFTELWDETARTTPGGLTRRTMTPELTAEANAFRRRGKAQLRCCGIGHLAPGHLPDTAWGGLADPGEAWVPLDQLVNQYIGGLTQAVPAGTTYSSVRSVQSISDC